MTHGKVDGDARIEWMQHNITDEAGALQEWVTEMC